MEHSYRFSILRITPDPVRGEWVNIGLVVFSRDAPDVRLTNHMEKILSLNPNFDLRTVRELENEIQRWIVGADTPEYQYQLLQNFGVVTVTEPGYFLAKSREEYEVAIQELLGQMVTPPRKLRSRGVRSRLNTEIRRLFRTYEMLAENLEDIQSHKVVADYPIKPDANLYVEFALKNGAFNVTETIDYRPRTALGTPKFYETGAKSLILEYAKAHLGRDTRRYVIYVADPLDQSKIEPYLNLLRENAEEVLNKASEEDMAFFARSMLSAAGKMGLL